MLKRSTGGLQASRVSGASLTEARVRAIRKQLAEGISPRFLADMYDTSVETIRRVGRRESWAWVKDDIEMPLDAMEQLLSTPASPEMERAAAESERKFKERYGGGS